MQLCCQSAQPARRPFPQPAQPTMSQEVFAAPQLEDDDTSSGDDVDNMLRFNAQPAQAPIEEVKPTPKKRTLKEKEATPILGN